MCPLARAAGCVTPEGLAKEIVGGVVDPMRGVLEGAGAEVVLEPGLAAVAGTLYGLDKSYKPLVYLHLVLPIFAAAIVGGVGNPLGAIVGGFVIAFSELLLTFAYKKVAAYLFGERFFGDGLLQILSTDYKFAVSFMILVVVLLVKPTGIFSGKSL